MERSSIRQSLITEESPFSLIPTNPRNVCTKEAASAFLGFANLYTDSLRFSSIFPLNLPHVKYLYSSCIVGLIILSLKLRWQG